MSLRALRKRDNNLTGGTNNTRSALYRKSCKTKNIYNNWTAECSSSVSQASTENLTSSNDISVQYKLLGRLIKSDPELDKHSHTIKRQHLKTLRLVRSKSDSHVYMVAVRDRNNGDKQQRFKNLLNAKSEVCLKSITAHNYQQQHLYDNKSVQRKMNSCYKNMLSSARSHRDLTQSYYPSTNAYRRMSEGASCNSLSTMTDRTLSSNNSFQCHDKDTILRIPIIGYEVMEERARFTVYKLRVENSHTNGCWLVLRRYTDFVRLNNKLKNTYPHYTSLNLPRKKFFGDNFKADFLDQRVQGLQLFVNAIINNEELRKSPLVREFFCLDEPPTYSESMEECRAIFEAQEETIAHLKMQLNEKNDLILELQQKLTEAIQERETYKTLLQNLNDDNHKSAI